MENVDEVLINFMVNEVSMHCLSDIGKGIFSAMRRYRTRVSESVSDSKERVD